MYNSNICNILGDVQIWKNSVNPDIIEKYGKCESNVQGTISNIS